MLKYKKNKIKKEGAMKFLENNLLFEETRRERVYDGFLKIDKLYFIQENVFGQWTEEFSREVIYRRNAVVALIIDPNTGNLLFTKQLRPGSYVQCEPWIYEMVAGLIDLGEDEITALQREAKEEAGIEELHNIKLISSYYPSAGGCTEKVSLYYAEADLSNMQKWGGHPEENEIIELAVLTFEEAMDWLEQGKIGTANGHVALYWLLSQKLAAK